jgi:hypothetical protein
LIWAATKKKLVASPLLPPLWLFCRYWKNVRIGVIYPYPAVFPPFSKIRGYMAKTPYHTNAIYTVFKDSTWKIHFILEFLPKKFNVYYVRVIHVRIRTKVGSSSYMRPLVIRGLLLFHYVTSISEDDTVCSPPRP